MILDKVKAFLAEASNGRDVEMPEETIENAGEIFKSVLRQHFGSEKKDNTPKLRMSSLGSPLCKQQLAHRGAEKEPEEYTSVMKFLYGDVIEILAFAIMEAAEVSVDAKHEKVELEIEGETIEGTLDVEIEGKVYDIKSVSDYSFKNKWNVGNPFQELLKDDPFGYVVQGYLYAEARKKPFGGWIVINKNTGEWVVVETPTVDEVYKKKALETAARAVREAREGEFKRCFEPEKETWYTKETGRYVLGSTCRFCTYKLTCWGDQIEYKENPKSKANPPPKKWYFVK